MKLEIIKLTDLKPLEHNVRKHNDNQINELVRSVEQFQQTRAIVVDEDNNILIGNGLYMALDRMGKQECYCIRKTGLTEIQKKKLILSDNKIYGLGADDYQAINDYIQEITAVGDFDIAGFDDFVLENMIMSDAEVEVEMKDYGKITDERFTQPAQPETPAVVPQATAPVAEVPRVAPVIPDEPTTPTVEKRYVVCPNCGEVIYID